MFQVANPKSTTSTSIPLNDWLTPFMKDLATDEKNRSSIEADEIQKAANAQAAADKAAADKAAADKAAAERAASSPPTRNRTSTQPTNPTGNPNGGGG